MSRPLKEGLDYFPIDTTFDDKIQALESVFKNDGLVWILKFWQAAYKSNNGEVALAGYHGVIHAENSRVTPEKQNKILELCLEIGLLIKIGDKKYTSNGIKKRLGHIIKERERWRIENKLPVIHADNLRDNPRDNPQETGESKGKGKVNTYIQDFFAYFTLKTNRGFKLTKANTELIQKRLNDGYTLEQLKQAVDNFIQDDWPDRSKHMDLIYCIGKQRGKPDALEKWLNFSPKPQNTRRQL